jgi:pimeloyl-ACP methyl ester carboxylesterase
VHYAAAKQPQPVPHGRAAGRLLGAPPTESAPAPPPAGRPPYKANSRQESEDFFLHSLDKWRQEVGLQSFILVGHSLGGYLATRYALQHPEQVGRACAGRGVRFLSALAGLVCLGMGPGALGGLLVPREAVLRCRARAMKVRLGAEALPPPLSQVKHLVLVCPAGIPTKPDGWESRFMEDRWVGGGWGGGRAAAGVAAEQAWHCASSVCYPRARAAVRRCPSC